MGQSVSELFVGEMEFAHGDWARMAPVAALTNGRWIKITNRTRDFPEEGMVFVPPSLGLGNAKRNSLWVFRKEPNARAAQGKDSFVVTQTQQAIALLDLSKLTLEEARVKVFERGFELSKKCGDRIALAVSDGLFCILDLEPGGNGTRRARASNTPINLFALPPNWLGCGGVEHQTLIPILGLPQLPVVRKVSWCSDSEFVERILVRARKQLAPFNGRDGLPGKETLQRIARALEQQELLPSSEDDIELDLSRLKIQWPKLVARFEAADELRHLVLESDAAKGVLERARLAAAAAEEERLRPILEARVRREIEVDLADAMAERDRILSDSAAAEARVQTAAAELKNLEEASAQVNAIANDAKGKLRDVRDALRDSLLGLPPREVQFARSFLERVDSSLGNGIAPRFPDRSPPWSVPKGPPPGSRISHAELEAALRKSAERLGLTSLLELDSVARAGELVLLTGTCADRALETYANCVSAGRIWSVSIDPSVIGLDDIWSTPPDRSPTAFAMAWTQAEETPDEVFIACVRGIDASPLHLWLPQLSAVLRSSARPRNLLVFATPLGLGQAVTGRDYPDFLRLVDWLVPVRTAQKPGESLRALARMSPMSITGNQLQWNGAAHEVPPLGAELTMRLSNLDGESAIRAARFACAVSGQLNSMERISEWVSILESPAASSQVIWLGVDDLKNLRFQE